MSNNTLRLQILMNAVDKATAPFKSLREQSRRVTAQIKGQQEALREIDKISKHMEGFKKLQQQLSRSSNQFDKAREKVRELRASIKQVEQPTEEMNAALKTAQSEARKLQNRHQNLTQKQREASSQLNQLGINTNQLANHERELQQRLNRTTSEMEQQRRAAERLSQQQERLARVRSTYDSTMAVRNQLAGTGAGMIGTGVATGYMLAKPISAYAEQEDAATQLSASMMKFDGSIPETFDEINKLAISLGDKLPGTTADFQNMFTTLTRQGMSAKTILGGLGKATAYLSVQLKMPTDAAAEFAAKMQDATSASEAEMMDLMDTIQKGYYLGVEDNNMLEGFSNLSPLLKTLKMKGKEAADALMPLLVITDQAAIRGSTAGIAINKAFSLPLDKDKVDDANDLLRSYGIKQKLNFTKDGNSLDIKYLFEQFDKLKQLNDTQFTAVFKEIWGDDAETKKTIQALMNKGYEGYQEVIKKMEAQASLQQRVDVQLGTLSNLWEAAGGTFTNTLANFAEVVSPELKELTQKISDISEKASLWIKQNPELAATIFKVTAAISALALAGGALSLTLAAILGPFAIMRFMLSTLGIRLLPSIGLFKGLTKSVEGVGNAMIWLAKSPFKLGIAGVSGVTSVFNAFRNPLQITKTLLGSVGNVLSWLVKSPLALVRLGVQALTVGFGLLMSPITIGILGITAIAAAVYKYWEPIKAFIDGVIEGFKAGVEPIAQLFAPLKPVFDWVIEKVKAIYDWFTDLLTPVKSTKESLEAAGNMGKQFGQFLADGINMVLSPLDTLKKGVTWLLEKLGLVKEQSKELEEIKMPVQEQLENAKAATSYAASSGGAGYITPTSQIPSYAAVSNFREHDNGGYIPRGRVGIVGEYGPELVNGPANITSRLKTAKMAAVAAMMTSMPLSAIQQSPAIQLSKNDIVQQIRSFAPDPTAPVDSRLKPISEIRAEQANQNTSNQQSAVTLNTHITINATAGQNAHDIAKEVNRILDERERKANARVRSSMRDIDF